MAEASGAASDALKTAAYQPVRNPQSADPEWVDLARVKAWMACPHLSWTGDEGPIAALGRFPKRWRCDGCGEVMTDA